MEDICGWIAQNKHITHLGLSNCSLKPHDLAAISKELLTYPQGIKSVDLSYNFLHGGELIAQEPKEDLLGLEEQKWEDYTEQFLKNMTGFIYDAHVLNHIDLSGL